MLTPLRTRLALVTALLALAPAASAQQRAGTGSAPAREGVEALEARLARAVDRVSLPHAARLLGRVESARAYRLPGYGLVVVLTPRMLPGGEGQVYLLPGGAPKHRRVRVESHPSSAGESEGKVDDEQIETFERQVLVLQRETEAARSAAEKEMERLVEDVRVRVAPPSQVRVEVQTAGPEAEVPPAPPQAPETPAPPAPPAAPLPPAPPPWKFWFETGVPPDKRTPEVVVADVLGAVITAVAAEGARLVGLAGDERITVAVDFVPGGLFAAPARPEKTLVVTARVKDVDARARGTISLDEFRRRLDVTEY
jgi:hypothetical protein